MSSMELSTVPAFTRTRRVAIVSLILLGVVGLDHLTKWLAIQYLMDRPPIIYLGDLFRLQYATNTGAFLSLGAGLPDAIRPLILTGLNTLILIVVGMFLIIKRDVSNGVTVSLALILSGGVGNMIDRVARDGVVVDFMNIGMPWGPFHIRSGIFNIADVAIMAGLFMMVGIELFASRREEKTGDKPEATPPAS